MGRLPVIAIVLALAGCGGEPPKRSDPEAPSGAAIVSLLVLACSARDVPHTFANLSGADARMLLICTPAGFERYFDRMAARIAGVAPPPEAAGPIPEVITLGPPLSQA